MRVMQVHCDWCLEPEPMEKWSTVDIGGLALDLCFPHAQRWESLTGGVAGSPGPGVAGRPSGTQSRKRSAVKPQTQGKKDAPVEPQTQGKKDAPVERTGKKKVSTPPVDFAAVRAWAQSQGLSVSSRGPVRQELVEQFLAAPVNFPSTVEFRHA